MDLEEKIKHYREISKQIAALEEQRKALGSSILQQMQNKTMQVAQYLVRRYRRLSISLPLDRARELSATKMEETIDREKIKALYEGGQMMEGVSEIEYIQVSEKAIP